MTDDIYIYFFVLVLLAAHAERLSVSCMQDFFLLGMPKGWIVWTLVSGPCHCHGLGGESQVDASARSPLLPRPLSRPVWLGTPEK